MTIGKLLLPNESAMLFQLKVAQNKEIGLNGAIVLQQVHYWIEYNKKKQRSFRDGRYWVFNTYEQWGQQFPFWSEKTIKRTFLKLQNLDVLLKGKYNKRGGNTLWYSIDYDKLSELTGEPYIDSEDTGAENAGTDGETD